ncbi:MAG: fumarylacetoacetate hydrolase family protein [Actinomycetes bacterium]
MKLATLRTADGTRVARLEGDEYVDLGVADVGALLSQHGGLEHAASADGERTPASQAQLAPVVPAPGKILCVGLNYRHHIQEMGREIPQYPTLFAKYPEALVGPTDPIELPPETEQLDWEAELAVVVGRSVRRASEEEAAAAIAGFAVLNDVTARDWQYRTLQWLQGKTFEATSPLGPVLVTPDELPGTVRPVLDLSCSVDGETVQKASTGDLVFDPVALVQYISTMVTLRPGDVIATGTPGGVGHARKPARYLSDGARLVTEISGIGRLENSVAAAGA